ncbi:mechanosensitive ion channel family protein [Sinimarinibacterium sp. NLF-5-8]|uniref:mechanosensitive ion channel family protein n=1 Tax=Sinimarinibacterium sp. NLF-5-8 TaxID=2698684 RepID=UPI00137C2532|nr:mechanosensitive ion channel domain-containing protein [Sinimarinibacterium sp. NLF-5-8]QHS08944.1 mechanosensitive ion channel [Sinimarinibacterium sp. NLF-5-8]
MIDDFMALLTAQPWAQTLLGLAALALVAWLADVLTRRVLLRVMRAATQRTAWRWDDAFYDHHVFARLAHMVPALVVQIGIVWVPGIAERIADGIANVAQAGAVLVALFAGSAMLTALESLYQATPNARTGSIKGYVQMAKIVLFLVGTVILIAFLIGRSPLLLLSGLGAVSAVLLLVFKDTILGIVASVQLASNDMLRVGDWITMPQVNADGHVIDIALHTVKVQNWDKTIITIPTWRLISDSYQNWRGMRMSGARRIKRALVIDTSSVRFLHAGERQALSRFRLLDEYLRRKDDELEQWNQALGEQGKVTVNQRRLTNLGTFRAYTQAYLGVHAEVDHQQSCMVRLLDPTPAGTPMEVYCFAATIVWAEYERIQSDIFDHLIAILPEFGLSVFQQPSGMDVRRALAPSTLVESPHAL